ncbi:DUF72 domain-containing protein [Persephonella sp.]
MEKLGTVLFQLPPSFKYSEENLDRILGSLDSRFTNVVEFRHGSWWREDVVRIFDQNGIVFCSVSSPKLPEQLVKTNNTVYIRFHGRDKWYRYRYSDEELLKWVEEIKKVYPERVFAYFNNDFHGYAPENALRFRELLENI